MVYYAKISLRSRIPTVRVTLATDDGQVAFRARWQRSPISLQRSILFSIRSGKPLWFVDEWGRDLCFRPERVWAAMVAR